MNKDTFLNEIISERKNLETTINILLELGRVDLDENGWTVKDFIVHITYWDIQGNQWLRNIVEGLDPEVIFANEISIEKVRLKQAEINLEVYERNKKKSLRQIKEEFHLSYLELIKTIERLTDGQLNKSFTFKYLSEQVSTLQIISWRKYHYLTHRKQLEMKIH